MSIPLWSQALSLFGCGKRQIGQVSRKLPAEIPGMRTCQRIHSWLINSSPPRASLSSAFLNPGHGTHNHIQLCQGTAVTQGPHFDLPPTLQVSRPSPWNSSLSGMSLTLVILALGPCEWGWSGASRHWLDLAPETMGKAPTVLEHPAAPLGK